ncbi:pyridoxal-phosphate dependent enzyme-domain-containing protein [Aspergillus minisclerotigenes]|uniref:Pyridoxal-phosphate dependent enzyme-domain-containing protein n=1 Tax=Aspergillus minisclerotigenes TaxID=656917 RepID=A0A5N6J507_9EURO|nr:pyridoxal-phosphate dependent enzyme-domain-containing protein [Aspergillus minisclerotigenes]
MAFLHHLNASRFSIQAQTEAAVCMKNLSNWTPGVAEIRTWPEYTPQPLRTLPASRKNWEQEFGPHQPSCVLLDRDITKRVTVCVATDGNQGRGLAYGVQVFGCRCVVYIHRHVSEGRVDRIKDCAVVIRVDREYEASVSRAKEDASMNDWFFVSSTSWSDFDNDIPQHVMVAYMVVVEEAFSAIPVLDSITHVFVCGGVGSIAAAIFQGFYTRLHDNHSSEMPRFIVVEPSEVDCLLQSAMAGETRKSQGSLRTLMAGLACRAPLPAAWKVLHWLASGFVAVPDTIAVASMKTLASGCEGDISVVSGESSAANMCVLLRASTDSTVRNKLGLDANSQVLLFVLEGATDSRYSSR